MYPLKNPEGSRSAGFFGGDPGLRIGCETE